MSKYDELVGIEKIYRAALERTKEINDYRTKMLVWDLLKSAWEDVKPTVEVCHAR